jgi:hypothetical protein
MAYRPAYRRPRTGPRPNKYDASCSACGRLVPAGTGILTGSRDQGYQVRHRDARWIGSPVSGRWAGGCEDAEGQPAYAPGGARVTPRPGRCEDAPCCGCCD